MCEDDYKVSPCGNLGGRTGVSQFGKFLGRFATTEDALEFIGEHMEEEQYYPGIYWVSDHGNVWPIDLQGNELAEECEEEEEEFAECEE